MIRKVRNPITHLVLLSGLGLTVGVSNVAAGGNIETAGAAEVAPASVQVRTVVLARRTLSEIHTAYGRVQPDPDHVANVTLPHAGLVSRLRVRLGQRVAAGQALLELDTAPQARMDFQQAQAAVDFARTDLERLRRLFTEQLATRNQIAVAKRGLRDAEARLEAQRKLGTGRSREVIRAPFAGIVTQLSVAQGQRVQAGSTALLLASRDALIVALGLEQEDAMRVKPGMEVVLSPVFQPTLKISAQVSGVHAMVNPTTRLVDVLVRIPATASDALVLGGTLRGNVTLRREQALAVPRSAVLRDGQGDYVFVVRDGRAHRVNVTTGLQQAGWIAVKGDLSSGDAVVTLGNYELREGMAAREVQP